YAHFPTQDELLAGCTSHVAAKAPPLPVADIVAAPDLGTAVGLLVDTLGKQHLHFEPWLAWRGDRGIPFLPQKAAGVPDQVTALVARVLRRHLGPGDHREIVAGWESILSFDFWHRLARGHHLSRVAARRVIVRCLLALVDSQPVSRRK